MKQRVLKAFFFVATSKFETNRVETADACTFHRDVILKGFEFSNF